MKNADGMTTAILWYWLIQVGRKSIHTAQLPDTAYSDNWTPLTRLVLARLLESRQLADPRCFSAGVY